MSKKNELISIRVPKELKDLVWEEARKVRRKPSEFLCLMIIDQLNYQDEND